MAVLTVVAGDGFSLTKPPSLLKMSPLSFFIYLFFMKSSGCKPGTGAIEQKE